MLFIFFLFLIFIEFQVRNFVRHHLYIVLYAHHPTLGHCACFSELLRLEAPPSSFNTCCHVVNLENLMLSERSHKDRTPTLGFPLYRSPEQGHPLRQKVDQELPEGFQGHRWVIIWIATTGCGVSLQVDELF